MEGKRSYMKKGVYYRDQTAHIEEGDEEVNESSYCI